MKFGKIRISEPWSRPEHQSRNYDGFGDAYDDDKYEVLTGEWKERE